MSTEEEREKGTENLFGEINENFLNLGKENLPIPVAKRTPVKINKVRPTPIHIVNKFEKVQ